MYGSALECLSGIYMNNNYLFLDFYIAPTAEGNLKRAMSGIKRRMITGTISTAADSNATERHIVSPITYRRMFWKRLCWTTYGTWRE